MLIVIGVAPQVGAVLATAVQEIMASERFEKSDLAKVSYELEGEPPVAFIADPSGST